MTTLVVGITGEVGREVAASLRQRGARVRGLVRSTPVAGIDCATGDLADPAALDRALDGCDTAVFITPHGPDEEMLGTTFIDACERARVRRLVYVSAYHPTSRSRILQRLFDGMIGLVGPHYRAKLRIERRVRATHPLSPVALNPSNFYQNDELGLPEILGGRYPQPLGRRPANRVDTRDIGDAAARAILDDIAPGAYPLLGPRAWTGASCADAWCAALGRPVTYAGDDVETWRSTVGARMPASRAHDYAKTYRIIQRFGIPARPSTIARTQALLGRPPRDYADYVRERALQLSSQRASA